MSLPPLPVTLGVEIEFTLAYLEIGSDTQLHDPEEKHRLVFPITGKDKERFSEQYIVEKDDRLRQIRAVEYPGTPTLRRLSNGQRDLNRGRPGIEVKSPALVFSSASLELVSEVCRLITNTYLVEVPPSAGLHVHVSAGAGPFNFRIMQALFVFLWTFESQLLSLHPPGRQQNEYCRNFRQDSSLARGWCSIHKRLPTIMKAWNGYWNVKTPPSFLT
ncbi:hypothetical protein IFR04_002144 [Cadophora malorum]|uniref:Amidoligase enzyme n=1 Tax=Cadophora malorum TaxID=108018 RepID=A0A8H7WH18_9HELO|nr:hypothetical protein IFR04_002144 [Cadophora malorum]